MPDKTDPIVLYLIIKDSLNMSGGKIAAQVGHGVQKIIIHYYASQVLKVKCHDSKDFPQEETDRIKTTTTWLSLDSRKVVLKADDAQWSALKEAYGKNCIIVKDNGLTEVAPGSETVMALYPEYKSKINDLVRKLSTVK